jgi:eukaryotic-like serine/threonine-protein kinase
MSGTASALVAPGAIVAGKYRLDAVIGEGGMGAVWAATHTGLGQAVAIKFISKEFVTSPEALRRFDAEAKAAAQLRSRHVVQVFDNGTLEDGTPYIAMELLRGENVFARVHRAGPVPLNEVVEILGQCCRALGRAHAAGIIHRDIKPDNIFLAQTDEDGILVKVVDFGIAKFASNPNDHGSTRTGAVLGTPLYMSPEQARGLKSIDYRTDLYSLGLVAYTMLTGNLAFSSESFGDLLLQICTAPLPSLCANAPWLPAAMETWFQRACARDPAARFVSAQEFADALRAASDGTVRASALPESVLQQTPGPSGNPAHAVSVGTASGMSRSGDRAAAVVVPKSRGALVAVILLLLVGAIAVAAVLTLGKKDHPPDPVAAAAAITASAPTVVAAPESASPMAKLVEPASPTATVSAAATGSVAPSHPAGLPGSPLHAASARVPGPPPPAATPSAAPHAPGAKPIDLGY